MTNIDMGIWLCGHDPNEELAPSLHPSQVPQGQAYFVGDLHDLGRAQNDTMLSLMLCLLSLS